ncbi:17915_t:CDS:1, partial [Cetraspora pellucida]
QNTPEELKNNENAIIKTLVTDYTTQEHNFIVNVTYPYISSRFKHFKNSIRPNESMLFVISQLEVIQNEFYIYAKDISYIDTQALTRKRISDTNNSQVSTTSPNTARSKLLAAHQSISENTEKNLENLTTTNTSNLGITESHQSDSSSLNFQSPKRAKTEKIDENTDYNED